MDDILDLIQDVAESIALYDLPQDHARSASSSPRSARCAASGEHGGVRCSPDVKRSEAILKCCEEIDRLESDADRVMRSALSKLFRDENDLKQVMKLRVIYELLERSPTAARTSPTSIEGIVLENS
jgi:uncharacterized protein Yka (UPF0111/DUF47 family)